MTSKNRISQRGWTFFDAVFWVVILALAAWVVKQYILHPEGLQPRPINHSGYEDHP